MNFDKNTIVGFVLLMILLFGYIFVTNQQQAALMKEKHLKDSIASLNKPKARNSVPVNAATTDSVKIPLQDTAKPGTFVKSDIPEKITIVENDLIKVAFTNKGGYPKYIELKNYKNTAGLPVVLGQKLHQLSYPVKSQNGSALQSTDIDFLCNVKGSSSDNVQQISYQVTDASGVSLEHLFYLKKGEYMIDWDIRVNGSGQLFPDQQLGLSWGMIADQQEKDLKYEKGQSNIGYYNNDEYNFDAIGTGDTKTLDAKTRWVGIKQQFFNSTIIAPNNFSKVVTEWTVPGEEADSMKQVVNVKSRLEIGTGGTSSFNIPLKLYYGPNDYHILKSYGMQLESHVQLGYGIFAFVKYINRYVIMPVFDFLHQYIASIGIVILLLTFFIRLIISPLTYTSYLSGAKMKVLRPEIDELKKKYGDDQQAFSMEQMKLFRQAGVNPLGGCIPALLQIPIFFALYSFFNATLVLRGQHFLWSHDLSGYDSILTLPFSIPWYGDHVSLFTITATLTSLLISIYNTQMTPQQDNPVFKYMIYIFPLMLLFIFNTLPSALTWYYTVSNVVTLLLQLVIQKFIINEQKIHAQIQDNKKKPVTQSKWQQKLEQIQDTNKKLQEMQKKSTKK
jgi:YidC/Oxa1 family membrane protein insertase